MNRWLICLLLTLACSGTQAALYKYVDEQGQVHYTDKPPSTAKTQPIGGDVSSYDSSSLPVIEGGSPAEPKTSRPKRKRVVLYSAAWCGVCKRAKAYMGEQGIRYTEYDVETSEKGRRDYALLNGQGVPIFMVGDKRMNGFSAERLEALLNAP